MFRQMGLFDRNNTTASNKTGINQYISYILPRERLTKSRILHSDHKREELKMGYRTCDSELQVSMGGIQLLSRRTICSFATFIHRVIYDHDCL